MQLFTTAQLAIALALASGVAQALPFTPEADALTFTREQAGAVSIAKAYGVPDVSIPHLFSREPQLIYGSPNEQDVTRRGIFGIFKAATGVIKGISGKKSASSGEQAERGPPKKEGKLKKGLKFLGGIASIFL